jgi:hypothetical protein
MALYQQTSDLSYSNSPIFAQVFEPGTAAPFGGIYKCTGCGHEIGTAKYHSLPPQNHHQHTYPYRRILWQPVTLHS